MSVVGKLALKQPRGCWASRPEGCRLKSHDSEGAQVEVQSAIVMARAGVPGRTAPVAIHSPPSRASPHLQATDYGSSFD
jgi:hypothetical protein